jgi:hypothetical protein
LAGVSDKDDPNEGLAGTYGSLQGKVGDHLTPDHEPQNALMEELRGYRVKRFTKIKQNVFLSGQSAFQQYSMGEGICLNMSESRHQLTRTFKGAGGGTKNRALSMIDSQLSSLPVDAEPDTVKKTIGGVVAGELAADQQVVGAIYSQPSVPTATRDRAAVGMGQVVSKNKARWTDLFP